MPKRLLHIASLLLSLLTGSVRAQQTGDAREVSAFFKVIGGSLEKEGVLLGIAAERGYGLKVDQKVFAFSVYNSGQKRDFDNIGYGTVVMVKEDTALCLIRLTRPGSSSDSIRLGDLIRVGIGIPPGERPELLLSLALRNISFYDVSKKALFELAGMLQAGSAKSESDYYADIVKDMRSTYELYKDVDLGEELMKPWKGGGRYKGKVPFELFRDGTRKDAEAFLQFVATYPAKYMGTSFSFAETFMTWVINSAPYSDLEVQSMLLPLMGDPARFDSELSPMKSEIKRYGMVGNLADSLPYYNDNRQQEKIPAYTAFLRRLADAVGDTAGKAFLAKALADVAADRQEYPPALRHLDTAVALAKLSGRSELSVQSLLKKSEVLGLMGKPEEGKAVLKELDGWMKSPAFAIPEEKRLLYEVDRIMYEGWIEYNAERYNTALTLYRDALRKADRLQAFSGVTKKAFMSRRVGRILKDQGKYQEAIVYLDRAARLYDSLSNPSDKAFTWIDIGNLRYDQGSYREAIAWYDKAYAVHRQIGNRDASGYSVSQKANSLWYLGRIDSAIAGHRQAIELRRGQSQGGVAYCWDMLGKLYRSNGFKSEALRAYDSSRAIRESLKDTAAMRENLINVGLVHHEDENYKRAIGYYEKGIGLTGKASANELYNLSLAWERLDLGKARIHAVECRNLSASTGNLPMLFDALESLTRISLYLNDLDGAARYKRSADSLMKLIGTANRQAVLHRLEALRSEKILAFDAAYASYAKALAIFDTTSKIDAVYTMTNMGGNLMTRGELAKAHDMLRKADDYAREIGSPLARVVSQNSLVYLCNETGELDRGIRHNDTIMSILLKNGNDIRYADAIMGRGMLFRSKGDFKTALENVFYADSVFEAEGLAEARANTMNNAGTVYFYQADYDKAIEYFKRSEPFFRKDVVDDMVLVNRGNLAECYYYQKKHREALEILDRYYPVAVKTGQMRMANSLSNLLGKVHLETGDTAKATAFFRECYRYSRESRSAENLIDAMSYLGRISSLKGRADSAEFYTRGALNVAMDAGYSIKTWEACYELGMVFYNRKRYDSAIRYFSQAVDIVEGNSGRVYGGEEARKLFTSDPRKVDLYNKIIASHVAVKNPAKASEYALRNSITAVNSKYGKDLGFADSTLKADIARADAYRSQIDAVDASIAKADTRQKKEELLKRKRILEEGYQNFLEERKEVHRDFDRYMRGGVNPEDLSNFKGALPDDMAVVSYVVNENQLYKFIVTNATLEIATTELREDINVLVNEFITALTSPDSGSGTGSLKVRAEFADEKTVAARPFREISEKLYDLLVSDLLPVVGGKRKLCIIPSGKLSNIPFQCLGRNTPERFRFLVEDFQISYTNRLDMFRSKGTPDRDLSDMAAFGNPDKSLTFAGKEVLGIQKIANAKLVLTEEQATEQKARESLVQNKYVHFATHGTLDYVKPRQSYLTFSSKPGSGDDGRLTIAEIDSIRTSGSYAELVTLSACETARPLSTSEDWYVSPANSFLRKKFKSVVASLWKVNDEATGILMREFYGNLAVMDKVEALQKAQETLSRNPAYSHPYYWGGFVLYGDWR
jgi:tetratricopeptide (TPR) repeat protein